MFRFVGIVRLRLYGNKTHRTTRQVNEVPSRVLGHVGSGWYPLIRWSRTITVVIEPN